MIGLKFKIFETKSQELIGRKKSPSSFLYHAVGQKKWLPNGSCSYGEIPGCFFSIAHQMTWCQIAQKGDLGRKPCQSR